MDVSGSRGLGLTPKEKTLLPGQGHGWEAHELAVLTLVVFGRLDEEFSSGTQRCASWELHFKPKGALHTTRTGPSGARMLMLMLSDSALSTLSAETPRRPRVFQGGVHSARVLTIFDQLTGGRPPRSDSRRLETLWQELSDECQTEGARCERPRWIRELYGRIRGEGERRLSLSRLADEFEVHPVYLARAFRRHYGRSIGDVRRRQRIDRGVAHLTEGRLGLSDLALELGYSDQSHFTREFKRETGWTPSRFRKAAVELSRLDDG